MNAKHWHVSSTGNHQAVIVDESGRNIAVAYDKADAPILAEAPAMVEALRSLEHGIGPKERAAIDAILARIDGAQS